MVTKVKVHTGNPEKPIEGEHEDLGLCYVSKITLHHSVGTDDYNTEEIHSYILKDAAEGDGGKERREAAMLQALAEYGYNLMEVE